MGSAFTTYNTNIVNKLINDVIIQYNGNSLQVKALWDTGATCSCISNDVVKQLALIPTGKVNISTPSGVSERNTYLVDLNLPNNVTINDLVVADSEIGSQSIGMLIGMDIINQGDFSVSNYAEKTTFTFRIPSEKKTDYVIEIKRANAIGPKHGKGKRNKNKKKK